MAAELKYDASVQPKDLRQNRAYMSSEEAFFPVLIAASATLVLMTMALLNDLRGTSLRHFHKIKPISDRQPLTIGAIINGLNCCNLNKLMPSSDGGNSSMHSSQWQSDVESQRDGNSQSQSQLRKAQPVNSTRSTASHTK